MKKQARGKTSSRAVKQLSKSKGPIEQSDKGKFKDADVSLSPDYTVTSTTDGGGLVLTNVEVVIIFWGSYWSSTSPAPSPSWQQYYQAFTGIVTGPYMTDLKQYRGVGPGTMLGSF